MNNYHCDNCEFFEDKSTDNLIDGYCKKYNQSLNFYDWWEKCNECIIDTLQAENAALRERLGKAATFALDMCSEDDCAGDGSVGLPPCDVWHAWDTDGNGVNIESGCYLKEYLTELKGG